MEITTNSPQERKAFLQEKSREAKGTPNVATTRIEIEGKIVTLPHFQVDINFPMYRLENGRTQRKQREYLHKHPDNPDLFTDSRFQDEAQRVQGEILESMASESKLDELLQDGQREPLLLTSTGFVLNGNRRLATLRLMRKSPKGQDVTRGFVDAVVLPDLSQKELSAIETRLQMAEEGKAPYHWLDQLLKIEHDINEYELEELEIARQMKVKTPTIQTYRLALTLVNVYLERRGWASQYFRVDDQKQAFETLAKKYRGFEGSHEIQAKFLDAAFAVMKDPPQGRSVHLEISDIAKHIHNLGPIPQSDNETVSNEPKSTLNDNLISELTKTVARAKVKSAPSSAESVREQLILAKAKTAMGDTHNLPIKNAKEANSLLAQIQISKHTTQQKQLKGQLQGLVKRAQTLIQEIEKLG